MPDHSMLSVPKVSSRAFFSLATLAVLLLTVVPLHAHHMPPGMEDVDEFEDGAAFMSGLRHPLLGMDHWLFAMAVGALVMAVGKRRSQRGLPASLLVGAFAGSLLGVNDTVLPGAQFSAVLTIALPALLLMLREKLPGTLQMGLVGMVALWQGNVHGLAWPLEASSMSYIVGMLTMTAILMLTGYGILWAARQTTVAVRRSFSTVPSL